MLEYYIAGSAVGGWGAFTESPAAECAGFQRRLSLCMACRMSAAKWAAAASDCSSGNLANECRPCTAGARRHHLLRHHDTARSQEGSPAAWPLSTRGSGSLFSCIRCACTAGQHQSSNLACIISRSWGSGSAAACIPNGWLARRMGPCPGQLSHSQRTPHRRAAVVFKPSRRLPAPSAVCRPPASGESGQG